MSIYRDQVKVKSMMIICLEKTALRLKFQTLRALSMT